jgi:segregation and condensation protein A
LPGPDLGTTNGEEDISLDTPNAETITNDPKKSIAQPPLNLLFNPSLIIKKDIWQINISALLEMLLTVINSSRSKDLRLCGIAALTSSMVHRLKVESIFNLEKIAMQRKDAGAERPELPIAELRPLEIPFRFETTYPVSLEDLMQMLESMIEKLANPGGKIKRLDLQPIEMFNFNQYFVKIEEVLQQ